MSFGLAWFLTFAALLAIPLAIAAVRNELDVWRRKREASARLNHLGQRRLP